MVAAAVVFCIVALSVASAGLLALFAVRGMIDMWMGD
jgi:hypothetical protein